MKITMGVDVLIKDNEAVGVNILTKVYCSGEASDACFILVILNCISSYTHVY